jgi:hypothetical protein
MTEGSLTKLQRYLTKCLTCAVRRFGTSSRPLNRPGAVRTSARPHSLCIKRLRFTANLQTTVCQLQMTLNTLMLIMTRAMFSWQLSHKTLHW